MRVKEERKIARVASHLQVGRLRRRASRQAELLAGRQGCFSSTAASSNNLTSSFLFSFLSKNSFLSLSRLSFSPDFFFCLLGEELSIFQFFMRLLTGPSL